MGRDTNPTIFDLIQAPEEFFGRRTWSGLWRGQVEDIMDPEKRGRMRVRVPQIHTQDTHNVPVNNLPWAEPCFQDADIDCGEFYIPYRLGSWVWVMFEGGNPDYPVWVGSWFGNTERDGREVSEIPQELTHEKEKPGYPHRRIFKTRRGHKIEFSDEEGDLEIKITDAKGNFWWFDTETNTFYIWWNGNKKEIITGDYTLCVDGTYTEVIGVDRKRTVHGDEHYVITGTHPERSGSRKVTMSGGLAENIGGSEQRSIVGSIEETVGADMRTAVAGIRAASVLKDNVVSIQGVHHDGGPMHHNSGTAAAPPPAPPLPGPPDARLPNPEETLQERLPPFPDKIPPNVYFELREVGLDAQNQPIFARIAKDSIKVPVNASTDGFLVDGQ